MTIQHTYYITAITHNPIRYRPTSKLVTLRHSIHGVSGGSDKYRLSARVLCVKRMLWDVASTYQLPLARVVARVCLVLYDAPASII